MENYLSNQRDSIFRDVKGKPHAHSNYSCLVLIYVVGFHPFSIIYVQFDVQSPDFEKDLDYYSSVVQALGSYSPEASVFCLVV